MKSSTKATARIKIKTFEADNLKDFETAVQEFYNANPTVKREDFIKTYFTSIPIQEEGSTISAQTHGFIVYEDIPGGL